MRFLRRFAVVTLLAASTVVFAACASSEEDDVSPLPDGGTTPPPTGNGGGSDGGGTDSSGPGPTDGGGGTRDAEAGPSDTTAPAKITDLAASVAGADEIALTWTAPSDVGSTGRASSYEIRYAKTPIATLNDFLAATAAASPPTPKAPSSAETFSIKGLTGGTAYYVAIRSRDAAGNVSDISNVATATTKARAKLLVSEVAMDNASADGFDFVELVVVQPGSAKGLEIRQSGSPNLLHTLADLDVVAGDRIVVHLTGLPGPTGFSQEDTTKSKTSSTETVAGASAAAYDVYSATNGIAATDNLVSVVDGTTTMDAVAYSNRDGDAAATNMAAWAKARTDAAWTFSVAPVEATNDCVVQSEAVAISDVDASTCGRFTTGMKGKVSINRFGTADTNSKVDFYVAAQTPGAANTAVAAPRVLSATAPNATTLDVRFDQEVAPGTVTAAAFTSSGVTITAANASANRVTLTTSAQAEGAYNLNVASTVTNLQGVGVVGSPVRFCAYSAMPATLILNELNPSQAGGADLIELLVTRGGPLGGYSVRSNPRAGTIGGTGLAVLPDICATTGDLVVVHLSPAQAATAPTSETAAKNEHPAATYAANYDNAWDVLGFVSGMSNEDLVVAVRDAQSVYIDVAVFSDKNGNTQSTTFIPSVQYVQGLGLWQPANCGGALCTTIADVEAISADWSGTGTSPTLNSARRTSATSTAASWAVGAPSWGATN